MHSLMPLYLKRYKRILTHRLLGYWFWRKSNYAPPSTYKIKNTTLLINSIRNAPWIETGTYLGETTKFLAKHSPLIITFEPSELHYRYVSKRFKNNIKIKVINSTSESALENILSGLSGDINFYLDGHASGDGTFENFQKTPIRDELAIIEKILARFSRVFVAIDDIRGFGEKDGIYPSKKYLVTYCERNSLKWKIEQDIFMFQKY